MAKLRVKPPSFNLFLNTCIHSFSCYKLKSNVFFFHAVNQAHVFKTGGVSHLLLKIICAKKSCFE